MRQVKPFHKTKMVLFFNKSILTTISLNGGTSSEWNETIHTSSYSCMPTMNNIIWKHNFKIMKYPAESTIKTCNYRRKTRMVTKDGNCLSEWLTKHLLIQLLINITMILGKTVSKKVSITIHVLVEINLVKKTLNFLSMYGNWKRNILIISLIGMMPWNHRNMFVDCKSMIYAFVGSSFL